MPSMARLDRIAKRLPPRRAAYDPFAELDRIADHFSPAVSAYVSAYLDRPESAGFEAFLECLAFYIEHGLGAPTLVDYQAAILTEAGLRIARAFGVDPRLAQAARGMCSSALAWEVLFADTETFGHSAIYTLNGAALVREWQAGHTDDPEVLTIAGIGEPEARLLAATD